MIEVGTVVRYNQRARDLGIKNIGGTFTVQALIPCTNATQRALTGASGWAHLSIERQFVSLALLEEACPPTTSGDSHSEGEGP